MTANALSLEELFQPDVLLPAQWPANQRRKSSAAARLHLAVLEDCLQCVARYQRRGTVQGPQYTAEMTWLLTDYHPLDPHCPRIDVRSCCEAIGLDVEAVRAVVRRWIDGCVLPRHYRSQRDSRGGRRLRVRRATTRPPGGAA